MCGITGGTWTEPRLAIDAETLRRMTDVLRHRGPDDEGFYASDLALRPGRPCLPGVALGHRRLAIIDVAGSRQPIANENETVWVVFNGEIYNFPALRRRLEGRGHRFKTQGDTETLVHLYEDEGPEMVGLLDGMFAFALWDAERGLLLLARDRLGKKPLVYRHEPGRLLFASQLKSLLQVPGRAAAYRPAGPGRISDLPVRAASADDLARHQQTAAGPSGRLSPRSDCGAGWRSGPTGSPTSASKSVCRAGEYAARLRSQLTAAVEARLQSEVPLGAFLSGGVDSTIIVGLMRQLIAGPLRTFSIGFPVPEYDETRYARLAAERFQTIHEEFRVEPKAVEVLPRLVWHFDEPFADSSALPTWYLAELTRQHVTVALTRRRRRRIVRRLPALRGGVAGRHARSLAGGAPLAGRRFLLADGFRRRRGRNRACGSGNASPKVFRIGRRGGISSGSRSSARPAGRGCIARSIWRGCRMPTRWSFSPRRCCVARGRDAVTAVSLADLLTYLPCDLMTKVDTASMAFGLECRQPFLDHRVVELAARMPVGVKFRRGRGKRILLETFADLLPPPIRRRRKMGFGVPLDHWFRHEMRDFAREVLFDPQTQSRGFFRPEAVRAVVR